MPLWDKGISASAEPEAHPRMAHEKDAMAHPHDQIDVPPIPWRERAEISSTRNPQF